MPRYGHSPTPVNRMTDRCKNMTLAQNYFAGRNKHEHELRVPTRTGKPGKMGRHLTLREKSGNFEQTGKVQENHTNYWKTQGI